MKWMKTRVELTKAQTTATLKIYLQQMLIQTKESSDSQFELGEQTRCYLAVKIFCWMDTAMLGSHWQSLEA